MKSYRYLVLGVLLAVVGRTLADNLSAETVGMEGGKTKEVAIALDNPDKMYAAFQFDVKLPDGITLATDDKGKYMTSLDKDRADDHTLTVTDLGENTYRFLSFSMTNAEFAGISGALVHLTVKADKDAGIGEKTASITGQTFTEAQGMQVKWDDVTFTINVLAPITIKAEDKERAYGESNPAWTYGVTGGEIFGTGKPVLSCEATATSPVGTYEITIEQGTVENPTTLTNGTLTVKKAQLTITAKSYTIKQGEALPNYEIIYSGFKNGETKSVLKKQPTISCSATSTNEPGTYTIIVSGAMANNYEITHVKGTLRILDPSAPTLLGDINGDGEVDVTDVVELIDMVLAGSTDSIGDINGDGEVDVTDVVELIDMVLAGV